VSCTAPLGGASGGSGNNRMITYSALAVGDSRAITLITRVNCAVTNGVTISNTVSVSSATPDPANRNASATITTAPSHLSHDLWWQQTLPDCRRCVYHIGEYLGVAFGSDGAANMVWADRRHYTITPQGKSGYTMNVDYARFDD